ncbi:hypothetical protein [Tenacibaculum aestuarii]|uniref:hypothetical protein n=1 Tax=Tenacibaculum aestuarii TaxID=362781 RepID=UPI0038952587
MKKLRIVILIAALILLVVNALEIDLGKLTNLEVNLNPYLGALSMALVSLSMILSIKSSKKVSDK